MLWRAEILLCSVLLCVNAHGDGVDTALNFPTNWLVRPWALHRGECDVSGSWRQRGGPDGSYEMTGHGASFVISYRAKGSLLTHWSSGNGTIDRSQGTINNRSIVVYVDTGHTLRGELLNCEEMDFADKRPSWCRINSTNCPPHGDTPPGPHPGPSPSPSFANVSDVHVIAMNHLDVGFTGMVVDVVNKYFQVYFPKAIATATELMHTDQIKYTYTTHCWLVSLYTDCPTNMGLKCPNAAELENFTKAVTSGYITWHAFPFNSELATYDAQTLLDGIDLCHSLDQRFGLPNATVISQRDVPGITRSVIPLLRSRGIKGVSVGANVYCKAASVPRIFNWTDLGTSHAPQPGSAGSSSVVTLVHPGGYGDGSTVAVEGSSHALALLFNGDNAGPHSPNQVRARYKTWRKTFPNAKILNGSTWGNFIDGVLGDSGGDDTSPVHRNVELPVVTGELADSWVWGTQSDPIHTAGLRAIQRVRTACVSDAKCNMLVGGDVWQNSSRMLLKLGEHTYGLGWGNLKDQKRYNNSDLEEGLRTVPSFKTFESAWPEQRSFIDKAVNALPLVGPGSSPASIALRASITTELNDLWPAKAMADPTKDGWAKLADADWGTEQHTTHFSFTLNASAGGFSSLRTLPAPRTGGSSTGGSSSGSSTDGSSGSVGREWVPRESPAFMQYQYQTLNESDFDRFMAGYMLEIHKGAYSKVNLDKYAHPESRLWLPELAAVYHQANTTSRNGDAVSSYLTHLVMPRTAHTRYGAPSDLWIKYDFLEASASIAVDLSWYNKTRTRQPEAHWFNLHADLPMGTKGQGQNRLTDNVTGPTTRTRTEGAATTCEAWQVEKLGSFLCTAEAITNGSPHMHVLGHEGVLWQAHGASNSNSSPGSLGIKSLDAGLVCLGYESAFPTDGRPMVAANGSAAEPLFVNLFNNFWTTNYPNWYPWSTNPKDANGRYRFELSFN